VAIGLTVSPTNSVVNGTILLSTNRVVFRPSDSLEKTVYVSVQDGTDISLLNGFTITPTVLPETPAAQAYYQILEPGSVIVMNVNPVILLPVPPAETTNISYAIAQGVPWAFSWMVSDVTPDSLSAPLSSAMTIVWDFGDGGTLTTYGPSGTSAVHTYTASGEKTVTMTATDKDGGTSWTQFRVRVYPSYSGFTIWAAEHGLSGDLNTLLGLDRDGDGIANGFEYAFGTNRTAGIPLLNIRMINGRPMVETPKRDYATTGVVFVVVEGSTNLLSGSWPLAVGPATETNEKPSDRDWYTPLEALPSNAFFRLRATLR
jgi:hypothetical protein